ncbi:MAG: tRNA (N(6)-L-threonylcarbamoyladenosine(37)-C(2))-methylthiotransferase MtaB [Bacteroidia bacterium]
MNQQPSAAFYTLGCKLNYSETSAIARQFSNSGYQIHQFDEAADVYVINTCSVTDNADKKCRQIVRKALRINPDAKVVVIGCYAQLKPQEISAIPGVNLVLGANEKFNILNYLDKDILEEGSRIFTCHIKETDEFVSAYSFGDRTRSFLKVQDGCNYFCSFCTIPLARGRSRSGYIDNILHATKEIARQGVKEVVLTGVNIGDFGNDQNENFLDLIKSLDQVEGINRYRISSIEPNLLSNEIIDFVAASQRFVPHFHIPLQSGADKILKAMRRRYLSDLYVERVQRIKEAMPDCCIGVDVIVGFPGEDENDFRKTYDLLHQLDVSYLHVFTYSERPNTTALRLPDPVPLDVRTERRKMLTSLSHKKRRKFYTENAGKIKEVLWEEKEHEGRIYGFTQNYVKVNAPFDAAKVNQVQQVLLGGISNDGSVACSELIPETLEKNF